MHKMHVISFGYDIDTYCAIDGVTQLERWIENSSDIVLKFVEFREF